MSEHKKTSGNSFERHSLTVVLIILALMVFIITWVGIRESRSDSFKLMVKQGTAFIETLTRAAENAIASERFFDYLVHKRYNEIIIKLSQQDIESINERQLIQLAINHNLYSVFVYGIDSTLIAGGIGYGSIVKPPDYVYNEICQLIANPEDNYVLLLDEGDHTDEIVHYYIEITNKLDRVILLATDALYYMDALKQTQIGYLAQNMAQEKGVEYIIYQSTEGIIFASRKPGNLLAIESDPFLLTALESDTVMHREFIFQEKKVLELIRPFSTVDYPYGLLRVGLSLDSYNIVSRRYDFQMITLSAILFSLVLVLLLYLNSRRKRKEITQRYQQIKSISDKIFEEMRIGVAAIDEDGIIILANNAFDKIFNIKDSIGNNWNNVVNLPEFTFDTMSSIRDKSFEQEVSLKFNGRKKSLLVAVSKMTSESNQPGGIVAVVYDISRVKELEQKSARRERLSEMGNLAAGVAHEIRNPLNTISIAAQRLAGEFTPVENTEEYITFTKQITSETKRLNEIISRFLTLTREDKKRWKKNNLKKIIDEFIHLVKYEAERLKIEITVDVESNLEIEGDSDNLKQVLSNLFNNAKEALNGKSGKVAIKGRRINDTIRVLFDDSGPGIESEIRDKVFTPYYTTKDAGTGLGLPTVYKIISDMGGEIKIEESELGGARFIINLPI